MLIEIYLLFEVFVIGLFLISFFTKQEMLWVVTVVLSALMMFSSYNIEKVVYEYNATSLSYVSTVITNSYPYMMGVNTVFFGLALILGFFDIFDKYKNKKDEEG